MRRSVTAVVMVAVLGASAALGASLGLLGVVPEHEQPLRPAIVVDAPGVPEASAPAPSAPTDDPVAAPVEPQVLAPDASWAAIMDQIAADREAQRLADEQEAQRLADQQVAQAAASARRPSAPKKVVPKPVVRDYDDDDDDDEWDDDDDD